MMLKKKSLIVVLISGSIISAVLVLTLIGYVIYTEIKGEGLKRSYQYHLEKILARAHPK